MIKCTLKVAKRQRRSHEHDHLGNATIHKSQHWLTAIEPGAWSLLWTESNAGNVCMQMYNMYLNAEYSFFPFILCFRCCLVVAAMKGKSSTWINYCKLFISCTIWSARRSLNDAFQFRQKVTAIRKKENVNMYHNNRINECRNPEIRASVVAQLWKSAIWHHVYCRRLFIITHINNNNNVPEGLAQHFSLPATKEIYWNF